ncbi:hypothetical protein HZS_572, partial [Henneguya salminicola]
MSHEMNRAGTLSSRIIQKLNESLKPKSLEVLNESSNHGNSSQVYKALDEEMKSIHALSIIARVPNTDPLV